MISWSNSAWRIQDGGSKSDVAERVITMNLFSQNIAQNWFRRVCGFADHDFVHRFSKFKMANPRWRIKIQNNIFTPNLVYREVFEVARLWYQQKPQYTRNFE